MNICKLIPNLIIGRAQQRALAKSGAAVDVVTRTDVFEARFEESPRLDVVFVADSEDALPPDDFVIVGRICRFQEADYYAAVRRAGADRQSVACSAFTLEASQPLVQVFFAAGHVSQLRGLSERGRQGEPRSES